MIPSSDRYKKAIAYDHEEIQYAELWQQNQYVKTLALAGGSLTMDATAQIRGRASLDVLYEDASSLPGFTPKLSDGSQDPLWPLGSEFRVYAGLKYPDATTEIFPQGVFRLSSPKVKESANGEIAISVDGFDRSKALSKNRWTQPYIINDGTNVRSALISILQNRLPNIVFSTNKLAVSSYTLPLTILEDGGQSDPNKDCIEIAQSAGLDFYFDVYGDPVTKRIPDPTTAPVDKVYTEDTDCTLEEIERNLDEDQAYSGVVVNGKHPDQTPAQAVAWDLDPQSPTYVGSYGYVPYFIDTTFLKDAESFKLQDIANQTLIQVKGIIEAINFTAFADFTHEAGDVLSVKRNKVKVNGTYSLDSFTRSLEPGASMQTVTRKQRVT